MAQNRGAGNAGKRYEEQCITRDEINRIKYQKGCAVNVILPGRGDDEKRRRVLAWIEGNYPHHIRVRIDTDRGPYYMSINKVDIVMGEVKIKEVV